MGSDADEDIARRGTDWLLMTKKTTAMELLMMGRDLHTKMLLGAVVSQFQVSEGTFNGSLQFRDRITSSLKALEGGGWL